MLLAFALVAAGCSRATRPIRVGSKAFVEGVILGEVAAGLARRAGVPVEHRRGLGGTRVLWDALVAGQIDAYPEYTGTIAAELLAGERVAPGDATALRTAVARRGVRMSAELGFDDTYALGVTRSLAARLGLRRVSDLRAHPALAFGFSHEFLQRAEGWPGLRARYGLPQTDVRGMQHELAYAALASGAVAATDVYTTDAEVAANGLRVLDDDLHHFPPYRAVWLYRADLARRAPAFVAALESMAGRIPTGTMASLNARARVERVPEASVAEDFLRDAVGASGAAPPQEGRAARVWARTKEHLALVLLSLVAAVLAAVPLGVLVAKRPRAGALILGAVGLVQTVPSLALLVFMIPLLGIGAAPAVAALFVYGLLPVVRNTAQGIIGIPAALRESAEVLGLPPGAILRRVELPLAAPSILAGVKTAAVINVGTATLGALVGAGGYGEPILTGIRLAHTPTILEGAVPAALMALGAQGLFDLVERRLVRRPRAAG
ncbi:MAG: glycine betaine ABC transporter substrate-binding protein [Polyangiales bacterium]